MRKKLIRRRIKTLRRPVRRRNAAYTAAYLEALRSWVEDETSIDLGETDEEQYAKLVEIATYLDDELNARLSNYQDANELGDAISDQFYEEEDLLDFMFRLNEHFTPRSESDAPSFVDSDEVQYSEEIASTRTPSSSVSGFSSSSMSEEQEEPSVKKKKSESKSESTSKSSSQSEELSELSAGDLDELAQLFAEEEEEASTAAPPPPPKKDKVKERSAETKEKTTKKASAASGFARTKTSTAGTTTSTKSSSEETIGKDPFGTGEAKVSYEMTEYDRLRLLRFGARDKKVRTELAPFFMFLQLKERSYPLPTVAGWLTALSGSDIQLPFSLDFRTERFRQNAFVLFRPSNGTSQLYLPSFNPIQQLSKSTRVKAKDYYWTPSLEFISRPELSEKDLFSLVPTQVYKDTDVPNSVISSHRIGSPNPLNAQSRLSWYQMIHGYIGTDNLNTPFRKKGKTDKFSAFGILVFVDDSETPNDMKLRLVDYIPSPRPGVRQYLESVPQRGMIRPNPRRTKGLPKKRKVLIVRKKR